MTNLKIAQIHVMIAQDADFMGKFLKERRVGHATD
jgi:hypothetical protein